MSTDATTTDPTTADITVGDRACEHPRLVWLDPASLVANRNNARSEIGDVGELASSIAVAG